MRPDRTCANPSCARQFGPTRSHHVYCSGPCRKQDWIRRRVEAARTRSKPLNGVKRRPSRNGTGARVYLTEAELLALMPVLTQVPLKGGFGRTLRKFRAALERFDA